MALWSQLSPDKAMLTSVLLDCVESFHPEKDADFKIDDKNSSSYPKRKESGYLKLVCTKKLTVVRMFSQRLFT